MRKKRQHSFFSKLISLILRLSMVVFCFTLLQVFSIKYIDPFLTPNVLWEWSEAVIKKQPEKKPVYRFKKLENISSHLLKAVIAAEDQRFFSHCGFDFHEIKNSLHQFINTGKIRGASTISMQAARSVFLLSSRRIYRKAAEAYYTLLMELLWDKQRILEIYLNTVDWGTGITGAEAAALKYFNRSAEDLTQSQAAWMAAILPNPHIWSIRKPSSYLKSRQKKILATMPRIALQ